MTHVSVVSGKPAHRRHMRKAKLQGLRKSRALGLEWSPCSPSSAQQCLPHILYPKWAVVPNKMLRVEEAYCWKTAVLHSSTQSWLNTCPLMTSYSPASGRLAVHRVKSIASIRKGRGPLWLKALPPTPSSSVTLESSTGWIQCPSYVLDIILMQLVLVTINCQLDTA